MKGRTEAATKRERKEMNTGLFEGYTTHPGHNYYRSHQNTPIF